MNANVAVAESPTVAATSRRWMVWSGWALSGLTILALAGSGIGKVTQQAAVLEGFKTFGYPLTVVVAIGVVELLCAALYAIPRTRYLGAILVAAYLGGAVATHVRVGDPFVVPIVLGVFAWAGLFLRDARFRALLLGK
jgi:hypothetical protein